MRMLAVVIVAVASASGAGVARADEGDGLYGRFDGDLAFSLAAGGGVVLGDDADAWALGGEARLRYLETAGLVVGGEWRAEGEPRVIVGLDLRPVFLWHFLTGAWSGSQFVDLMIGSIGLDLGLALGPGVALAVGLGVDVPIAWGDDGDPGVFLHLGARHVTAASTAVEGPQASMADWLLHVALGVRFSAGTSIATHEPARYEMP